MTQRFFCVDRRRTGEISEVLSVLGSTGNASRVFCVLLRSLTACAGLQSHGEPPPLLLLPRRHERKQMQARPLRPAQRSVSLPPPPLPNANLLPRQSSKFLQVPLSSNLYYQKALLTSELVSIFSQAPRAPLDVATERLRSLYKVATGQEAPAEGGSGGSVEKRLPEEGDSCPVCCESSPLAGKEWS